MQIHYEIFSFVGSQLISLNSLADQYVLGCQVLSNTLYTCFAIFFFSKAIHSKKDTKQNMHSRSVAVSVHCKHGRKMLSRDQILKSASIKSVIT